MVWVVYDPHLFFEWLNPPLPQNEDCGQMSAWWLFSALGFYPVNPSSDSYVVGTPFFDKVTVDLPGSQRRLIIHAPGAATKPYVRSMTVNGRRIEVPSLTHRQIVEGGNIVFEMSADPQEWGSGSILSREEL
jgi:putative alpha-1,2-mannosidase